MARIVYSALVDSINGSIKGTTFQRSRYGNTIKGKPQMNKPNTVRQNQSKLNLSRIARSWLSELSGAERDAWNSFATTYPIPSRLNPDAYLNGFAAYCRRAGIAFAGGDTETAIIITDSFDAVDTPIMEVLEDSGDITFALTNSGVTEDWTAVVFLSRPVKATQQFAKSWTREMTAGTFTGGGNTYDVTAAYAARFGIPLVAGDFVAARAAIYQDGNGQVIFIPPTVLEVGVG